MLREGLCPVVGRVCAEIMIFKKVYIYIWLSVLRLGRPVRCDFMGKVIQSKYLAMAMVLLRKGPSDQCRILWPFESRLDYHDNAFRYLHGLYGLS